MLPAQQDLYSNAHGRYLQFNQFNLKNKKIIQPFIDNFQPISCEYNFSNLFSWQYVSKLSWIFYQERLLIYDGIEKSFFMPLGKELCPKELIELSQYLKNRGSSPDFALVPSEYLEKFPEIEQYYIIKKERNYAEYIYDVNELSELKGKKLHKKRNLISQFKRNYPDFKVYSLKRECKHESLKLAKGFIGRCVPPQKTLVEEYEAIKLAFDHFDELGLEGVVISSDNKLIAFNIFSRLNDLTYDIQFEKADIDYKGASQMINQETAKYLKGKCQYLNREQDLGIKGLRRAKMSYVPFKLVIPYSLIRK